MNAKPALTPVGFIAAMTRLISDDAIDARHPLFGKDMIMHHAE